MGFLRNFEIWSNQRPRVCNFDIMDYIDNGVVGNNCTGNITPIDEVIWWDDCYTTGRATREAWAKAVEEYAQSVFAFYRDDTYTDSIINTRCITLGNYQKLLDLMYGPNGFWQKYFKYFKASILWWNCVVSADKQTGIQNYTCPVKTDRITVVQVPFAVNFSKYQTPTKAKYLEYRAALDELMASLKIFMQVGARHPLTHYTITPPACPNLTIGTQVWNKCNLKTTTYRNGDVIPQVTDPDEWANLTTGAWCYYNNDPTNEYRYGKLYNWYAVNDPRGLAPVGYHIPTEAEWDTLINYVGGDTIAGEILKAKDLYEGAYSNTTAEYYVWQAPNVASNIRGFTAVGGGSRINNGSFWDEGLTGYWWTSSESNTTSSWRISMYNDVAITDKSSSNKKNAFSVRIIKD